MRSGKVSSAFLKADVRIYESDSEDSFDSDFEESDESEDNNSERDHSDIDLKEKTDNLDHHEKVY